MYIVSTSGGPIGQGQIFEYELASGAMRVLFASPAADILNNPDNITGSPRGGIMLCEDGSGLEYLHGLTPDGEISRFAANNIVVPAAGSGKPAVAAGDYTGSEWAGATFEPKNGNWGRACGRVGLRAVGVLREGCRQIAAGGPAGAVA